ncbi:hypothetical protein TOPH_03959 [Tolypocladium ophioglossoides CBS 100239]|uniref:Uncharacterized protein n=1 Tax=Tolypocladium ophioglossoides (strain CBS 100239) TaxID=1163406 RepID=A0A0L0NBE3_TOLOC|nr:hypothetical protein TOPH_03959 [Tolypocladium ophioglossoides CBS 100239]
MVQQSLATVGRRDLKLNPTSGTLGATMGGSLPRASFLLCPSDATRQALRPRKCASRPSTAPIDKILPWLRKRRPLFTPRYEFKNIRSLRSGCLSHFLLVGALAEASQPPRTPYSRNPGGPVASVWQLPEQLHGGDHRLSERRG